jgi:hypothetical protein
LPVGPARRACPEGIARPIRQDIGPARPPAWHSRPAEHLPGPPSLAVPHPVPPPLALSGRSARPRAESACVLSSVGIDIIETGRMRDALRRRPGLTARLFTADERAYCDRKADPAPHYAARFAATSWVDLRQGSWYASAPVC